MSANTPHADRRFSIEGVDLGYPTLFDDGSTSVGMYVVSSKVANELIAESGFTVAEIAPGKAVLSFSVGNRGSKTLKPLASPVH